MWKPYGKIWAWVGGGIEFVVMDGVKGKRERKRKRKQKATFVFSRDEKSISNRVSSCIHSISRFVKYPSISYYGWTRAREMPKI